jgi:CRISPR/Cas system-associated exonuclease Cas4 (RecB family)
MVFGGAIHKALEVFYREGDRDKAERVFIDEFSRGVTNDNVELKKNENVEKEGKIGLRMLERYFDSPERPYFKVKEVEYEFQIKLKDPMTKRELDLPLKGVIDLITEDGLIVDHKVVNQIWKTEEIETDLQATCYWLAYESIFGESPQAFVFNFLIKRVNEPKFDAQATQRDAGQKLYFIEYANYIIKNIKEEKFPKKVGSHCRYCPFRNLCL